VVVAEHCVPRLRGVRVELSVILAPVNFALYRMKYVASAAGGFLLACVLFMVFVVPKVKENWRAQGPIEGALKTNLEVHRIAMKHLPENSMNCALVETLSGR
jgi:hypothetical protein